jgi:type II secretory pathway pseudopilin PulG
MKSFFKFSNDRGFSLVEALVAVLILTMGLIPSLTIILLANSFNSAIKNSLIAANLAQEGLEVVRAIRDANWFADGIPADGNPAWDTGLAEGTYLVEWNSLALLPENGNPPLRLNNGLYNYSAGNVTGFQRRIFITKDTTSPGCDCELRVIVELIWPERSKTRTMTFESHLFNWN